LRYSFFSMYKFTIAVSIFASISFASQAINTIDTIEKVKPVKRTESIEIITVTGSQPLKYFRKQFQQAEEDLFDALNALDFEESFKIECGDKRKSFSRIKRRVCEPKFVDGITYEMTRLAMSPPRELKDHLYRLPTRTSIENKISAKHKVHLAKVRKAVESSSELQLKLLNLNKAKYVLEQKKKEVFGENMVSTKTIKNFENITQNKEPK
jgi:hypothetical protein